MYQQKVEKLHRMPEIQIGPESYYNANQNIDLHIVYNYFYPLKQTPVYWSCTLDAKDTKTDNAIEGSLPNMSIQ